MPKASPIYPTFSSGEVSPLMYGRVDMQQYFNGLAKAENCLVRPYGLCMSRAGLEYIAPVKFPDKETRIIDFVFNQSDAYTLEMGEYYFRFFTLGSAVTESSLTITASTQANPCQLTITSHGYSVDDEIIVTGVVGMTELNGRRFRVNSVVDPNNISLKDLEGNTIDSTGYSAYVSGGLSSKIYEVVHPYSEAQLFDVHYAQVNDVLNLTHGSHPPAELIRMASNDWTYGEVTLKGGPFQDENDDLAWTVNPSATTGNITITASQATWNANHVGSLFKIGGTTGTPSVQGYVEITGFTSSTSVSATVKETLSGSASTDEWAYGSFSVDAGYPATVTFHERRRWYARTNLEPQTKWASKPFIYDDYATGDADDDALALRLNTEKANDIKWLSSGTTLATGTFGGEFVTSAGQNQTSLTPDNANATRQTGWGSLNIQPQKIASYVYYVQRGGRKIRELFYYWDLDQYKSVDMTILSEHITESGIKSIAYQQNPDTTLHCIRNDGQIASLVREDDQEVKAWTRQVTDGEFESMAVIPNVGGEYDECWVVVKRTINGNTKRYIERFESPIVPERQDDCFYVDSGLKYNAFDGTTGNSLTLSALTGTGITVTAGSAIFALDDIGQRVRAINSDGDYVGEVRITGYTSDTVVTGDVTYDFDSLTYSGNEWGLSVTTIRGLEHLEAKTVSILADGAVQTEKTVASGEIEMERDAFKISVGLPYRAIMQTLSIEAGSEMGTAQGKKKRLYQLGLKVYKTLGIKIGGSEDKVFNVTLRNPQTLMGTPEALVTDTIPNILFTGGWVYEGEVVIVQDNPLPMHILDIMPLLKTSDR